MKVLVDMNLSPGWTSFLSVVDFKRFTGGASAGATSRMPN
jgi:hypothetical protein